MPSVRYTFSLNAVQDADLVRWLELQPNTSAAIREALRGYVGNPTLAEIDAKLDLLLDALRGVQVVGAAASDETAENAEPAAARRGLEAMKRRFGK